MNKYLKISVTAAAILLLIGGIAAASIYFFGDSSEKPSKNTEALTADTAYATESMTESDETSSVPETTSPAEETAAESSSKTETTAPETTEPAPTETEPATEPAATETVPTEPVYTEPAPTEPAYTEPAPTEPPATEPIPEEPDLSDEGEALAPILKPAQITVLHPTAPGTLTESSSDAVIDYSKTADGYVMAKFHTDFGVRLKVQVTGPTTTYTYSVDPGEWTVFPLSDGNGAYTVKLFRNVVDNRYSTVLSASMDVSLKNEFAPFLRPNQYVNYENEPITCQTASTVTHDGASMIEKVKAVYNYVVTNISYDYEKAATVQSGYLPDLDQVLTSRRGICFDYAALMAGMLRSLDVPCKLVIGYAGVEYHAWISVWSEETGWVDGVIFFNGVNWQTMDPTFAATGSADAINRITYTSKYVY